MKDIVTLGDIAVEYNELYCNCYHYSKDDKGNKQFNLIWKHPRVQRVEEWKMTF
jgi:hypothetical protein